MYGIIKRLFVSYGLNFAPKLYEVIRSKGYNTQYFRRDAVAGLTLAIISIPLGMAFAIASGASPAQGLYTAVVAGFFIAAAAVIKSAVRPALLWSLFSIRCSSMVMQA